MIPAYRSSQLTVDETSQNKEDEDDCRHGNQIDSERHARIKHDVIGPDHLQDDFMRDLPEKRSETMPTKDSTIVSR